MLRKWWCNMKRAYVFLAFNGAQFAVVADDDKMDGAAIERAATTVHEEEFGAGTNDKLHSVRSYRVFEGG